MDRAGARHVRDPQQVARHPGDVFFLNLPLASGSSAAQEGRRAELAAGDFALVDSTRPFDLRFERGFEQVSLVLPYELLAPKLAAPAAATAVPVRGHSGVRAIVASAVRSLAVSPGCLDRFTARALTEQLAALIALALGRVHEPARSSSRALLLQAALDEVERSLGEAGLSPSVVASRVGVSTRYLHQLFKDRGTSFGRHVLNRRLDCAHRDLVDPARAHWSIAEVAIHNGFSDPSYFGRAFRGRYGVTPREARRKLSVNP